MLTHIEHTLREFGHGLRRSLKGHLAPVVLLGVALFILGLFLVGTINLQELIHIAHSKVGIAIYLTEDAPEQDRTALADRIPQLAGVKLVRYISPEQALARFQSELGGRAYLLEGVEGNPLPASFEVELYDDYKTIERIEAIANEIRSASGVDSVIYGESWVGRLERWIYFLVGFDLFLGAVLGISTLLVVGNTMKLALENRRDAIEVIRLVGGTRMQIRFPFLLEGVLIGLMSSGLAYLVLYKTYTFAVGRLAGVLFLGTTGVIAFFALGALLGASGSLLSINRYLKA